MLNRVIHGTRIIGPEHPVLEAERAQRRVICGRTSSPTRRRSACRSTPSTGEAGRPAHPVAVSRGVLRQPAAGARVELQAHENVALVGQFHDEIVLDWTPGILGLAEEARQALTEAMCSTELPSFPLTPRSRVRLSVHEMRQVRLIGEVRCPAHLGKHYEYSTCDWRGSGLVHTGVVSLVFEPSIHKVVNRAYVGRRADAGAVAAWIREWMAPRIYVEQYRTRQHLSSDMRTLKAELDRHDRPCPVLASCALWASSGSSRRIDGCQRSCDYLLFPTGFRAAARIALLGMVKDDDTNAVLADVVRDHLDGNRGRCVMPECEITESQANRQRLRLRPCQRQEGGRAPGCVDGYAYPIGEIMHTCDTPSVSAWTIWSWYARCQHDGHGNEGSSAQSAQRPTHPWGHEYNENTRVYKGKKVVS